MKKLNTLRKLLQRFVFAKKVGDEVKEGDTIGFVHADDEDKVKYVLSQEIAEIN